jgi:nitrate reductase NapE component
MGMTSAPDPAGVTGPDLPRDSADDAQRRRGLGAAFWAMIAFGVFCAVAGGIVGCYGPKLFLARPKPSPAAQPAAALPPAASTPSMSPAMAVAAPTPAIPAADVAVLGDRRDHLQAGQRASL